MIDMADREKFVRPDKKAYSVKELLKDERLQEAMSELRGLQTYLWETTPDEVYEKIERTFDTAMASMMAHLMNIVIDEAKDAEDRGNEEKE